MSLTKALPLLTALVYDLKQTSCLFLVWMVVMLQKLNIFTSDSGQQLGEPLQIFPYSFA
jgi:hypothetical protein